MACRYTYKGKTYEAHEFDDVLRAMTPDTAAKYINGITATPSAPFVTDTKAWVSLAIKRMIAYAAENGFDKVAFISGQQAADLYDLSKQVDSVEYRRNPDGGGHLIADDLSGRKVIDERLTDDSKIEDYIGKESAQKLLQQDPVGNYGSDDQSYVLNNADLKVGGDGMRAFYDQIVPQVAKKLVGTVDAIRFSGAETDTIVRDDPSSEFSSFSKQVTGRKPDMVQLGFTITPAMRERVSGGLPLFAKNRSTGNGIGTASAQKLVDGIRTKWKNAPDIVVVQDMNDSAIPQPVRDENERQLSQGATGQPEGFFYDGKVYLVASELRNANDVSRVIFHETLGHYGLRGTFGDSLKPILKQVVMLRRKEVVKKAISYGLTSNENDLLIAAEEVLAEMAQKTPDIGVVKRAIAAIRKFMRDIGIDLELTDSDIIASYLIPARRFVEGGGKPGGGIAFSRSTPYEERADNIMRAFENMGLIARRSGSRISQSEYVEVESPEYTKTDGEKGRTYKFRLSDHMLPWKYDQPDYDVKATRQDDHGGLNGGDWMDAVEWLSRKLNIPTPNYFKGIYANQSKSAKNEMERIARIDNARIAKKIKTLRDLESIVKSGSGYSIRTSAAKVQYLVIADKDRLRINRDERKELRDKYDLTENDSRESYVLAYINDAIERLSQGKGQYIYLYGFDDLSKEEWKAASASSSNSVGTPLNGMQERQAVRADKSGSLEELAPQKNAAGGNENVPAFSRRQPDIFDNSFNIPNETSGQTIRRLHQDKLIRIKAVQDAISEQGGEVGVNENVYLAMERSTGRIADRMRHFRIGIQEPLMKRVAKLNTNLDELGTYLMALGAKDRNALIQSRRDDMPNNGSGLTNEQAAEIIADYKKRDDFADFDKLARDIQAITKDKLDMLVKSKVMTKDQAKEWSDAQPFYVPYKGFEVIDDDLNKVGNGVGMGYSTSKRASPKAMGRISLAGQVVENIIRDYNAAIILSEKAQVGEYMHNLVEKNPDPYLWTISEPEKVAVIGANDKVQYRDMGFDPEKEIRYIKDGEELRIQIHDPLFVRAYNNLGADKIGYLAEAAGNFGQFLRQMYVQKNPNFLIKNTIRDSQTAFIVLTGELGASNAAKVMALAPKAAKASFSMVRDVEANAEWEPYIKLYNKSGAGTAFARLDDLETQQLKLEETIAKHGNQGVVDEWRRGISAAQKSIDRGSSKITAYGKAVTKTGRYMIYRALDNAVFNTLEALNSASENAFRLAAFRFYIDDHGGVKNITAETLAEASRIAKNVTINFNRAGEHSSSLNAFYLFWKASINGSANVHRALTDTPHKKQAQAISAGLFSLGVMMAMLTGDDDDELSAQYDKEHNLLIHGDGTTWKLILAYGFGFFYGAGYTFGNMLKGRVTPIHAAVNTIGQFFDNFSPVGSPVINNRIDAKAVALMATPTILDPMTVIASNQTPFGNKLVPHFSEQDGKLDRETMNRGTRGTWYDKAANSKMLAWADISPETMKYVANTLTGGSGGFLSSIYKTTSDVFSDKPIDVEEVPFVKNFYSIKDIDEYRGRFYEQTDDIKQIAMDSGKKQSQIIGVSVVFLQKQMKRLRDREDAARSRGDWDAVENFENKQIEFAKKFNTRYHRAIEKQDNLR